MPNVVRNPYSNTAGNTPSSLGNGQIAVNQADGRLFYRSSGGTVTTFSAIASYATAASFPATGSASTLYLATDSSRLYQWTGSVYAEAGVSGGSGGGSGGTPASHASSHATGGSDAITPLSIGAAAASHTHTASQVSDFATEAAKYGPVVSVNGQTGTVTVSPVTDGSKGDIVVSDSGATWSIAANAVVTADIANSAVTDAKIASVSAAKISGLAAVATSGSAADLSAGTLPDARLSSAVALQSQINTTLGQASGVVDAVSRVSCGFGVTASAGQLLLAFFTPTATITVSQITMATGTGAVAAGLTLARMGIYTYPTDGGTATLVARTASDTTLFAANNVAYTRSLDTAGGFPATYTLTAGTRYGVAYLCVGTTQPQLVGRAVLTAVGGLSPRLSGGSGTGQTDLPSTFTPSANSQAPYARLS